MLGGQGAIFFLQVLLWTSATSLSLPYKAEHFPVGRGGKQGPAVRMTVWPLREGGWETDGQDGTSVSTDSFSAQSAAGR